MINIKLKHKIFLFLLACVFSVEIWAEIETTEPIKIYKQTGGDESINFQSYGELIAHIDAKSQQGFSECLSEPPPYSCTLYTITGMEAEAGSKIFNGELSPVRFPRNAYNVWARLDGSGGASTADTGPLGGNFYFQCPTGWFSRTEVVGNNESEVTCIRYVDYYLQTSPLQEEQCPKEGNPCNPLTGNKFQIEQDFSSETAHGLTFSRQYNSLMTNPSGGSALGRWQHNYNKHLQIGYTYQNQPTSDSSYDTAEKACSSGWGALKGGYANGSVRDAQSRMVEDTCEIYSDDGIIARFEIFRKGKNQPIPASVQAEVYQNAAIRPDGNTILFKGDDVVGHSSLTTGVNLVAIPNGFEFIDSDGSKETYNSEGKLLSIISPGGSIQTLEHQLTIAEGGDDNPETLDKVSNQLGQVLYFSYDDGLLSNVNTPDGDIGYTYVSGLLDTVTYPDGKTRQYHYEDSAHPSYLTGITDENGERYATWSYYPDGKVQESKYFDDNEKVFFVYNVAGQTRVDESVEDNRIARRYYKYRLIRGMLKTIEVTGDLCTTCGNGEKKFRDYDGNGFLDEYTDWHGNKTSLINNSFGYPTSITQGVSTDKARTTTIAYHSVWHSLPTLITEPGRKTDITYHADGRLKTRMVASLKPDPITGVVSNESRTTTWTYDTNNLLDTIDGPRTEVTDVTDYDFDSDGKLLSVKNALGQITTILEHDASGRPKQIQDANGQLTIINYFPRGWIKDINYAGAFTQFVYDGMGQLEKTTLPNGVTLSHEYDTAHRLIKTTDALGNYIDYEYDLMGNLRFRKINDASAQLRNSLEQTYYDNGWLKEVIGATNQQTTTLVPDEMGNVKNYKNPRGNSSDQVFDALNRLEQITDAKDGITKYVYDTQGNLKSVEAPNGAKTVYEYNGFGERIKRTSPDTGVTSYTYTKAGQVETETDARGIIITNTYDALNRTKTMTASDGQQFQYFYDETLVPNEIGRLSRVVDNSGETKFDYDVRGNRTAETRVQDGITTTVGYSYNAADQLETMTYPSGHIAAIQSHSGEQAQSGLVAEE